MSTLFLYKRHSGGDDQASVARVRAQVFVDVLRFLYSICGAYALTKSIEL